MGMDIRIKCTKCQHSVLIPRVKFEKNMKKVLRSAQETEGREIHRNISSPKRSKRSLKSKEQ